MINLLTKSNPKVYSLLSIGQRGVGKTVFLLGSYTSLNPHHSADRSSLQFDCQDDDTQSHLNNILDYIAQTGQYPPGTMKITNFDLSLKQRHLWGEETLCDIRWWDTPGESCKLYNPAFLSMMLNADGCCLFIDAFNLIQQSKNSQELDKILEPAKSMAEIIAANELDCPMAIVLTKCDLLKENPRYWQRLQNILNALSAFLNPIKVNYQIFYSGVPIVSENGITILKGNATANPILWLTSELRKADQTSAEMSVAEWINDWISNLTQPKLTSFPTNTRQNFPQPVNFQEAIRNDSNQSQQLMKKTVWSFALVMLMSSLAVVSGLLIKEIVNSKPVTPQPISKNLP